LERHYARKDHIVIEFSEDTNGGDKKDFSPLPDGDYQATIYSAVNGESNTKRTPQIEVEFRITGPTHAKRRVWDNFYLTTGSLWRLKQLLVAAGALSSDYVGSFDENTVAAEIQGETVTITLTTEEFNGKQRNRVSAVAAPAEEYSSPF
jgi:hypothetical protein